MLVVILVRCLSGDFFIGTLYTRLNYWQTFRANSEKIILHTEENINFLINKIDFELVLKFGLNYN